MHANNFFNKTFLVQNVQDVIAIVDFDPRTLDYEASDRIKVPPKPPSPNNIALHMGRNKISNLF